jgi:branched-chain amino acid transport system substrate-binding protein
MKRSLALGVFLALSLSACQPAIDGSTGPITIGFVGPLTGDAAAVGADMLNGAKLAIDEMNAKGGVRGQQVKIIAEDGRCTPAEAANAFQKLVNVDKVTVIIGGLCSGETLAGAPIAEAAKIVMISPGSSSPKVTDAGDYVFRNYPSDAFKGIAIAKYFKDMGYAKVAIITQNTDYATGLRDSIVTNVGEDNVVFNETVEESGKDFRSLLTRLKDMDFDVFVPNMQTDGAVGTLVAQYVELGLKKPIVGTDTADSMAVVDIAGDAAEGVSLVNVPSAGEGKPFEATFTAKFGKPQSSISWASYSYDAANILMGVMEDVGTDGTAMKDALYDLDGYKGIVGTVSFDKNGDPVGVSYVLKQFKDGAITTVKDIPLE